MNDRRLFQIFTSRVSVEVYNVLKEIAKADRRSLAYIIDKALTEYANKEKAK